MIIELLDSEAIDTNYIGQEMSSAMSVVKRQLVA